MSSEKLSEEQLNALWGEIRKLIETRTDWLGLRDSMEVYLFIQSAIAAEVGIQRDLQASINRVMGMQDG